MNKKIIFVLAVVTLSMLAIFLCACVDSSTPDTSTKPTQPVESDGWEKITVERKDMYTQFLLGFTNIAYSLSKDKVDSKGAITVDGSGSFSINGNNFYLSVKGKYDSSDSSKIREKAILSVELATGEELTDDNRVLSIILFKDELYCAIGSNKVKFDVSGLQWEKYYPYDMEQTTSNQLSSIGGLLASYVKLNDEPKIYFRRNSNKEEYKYSVDVNLKKTIKELCSNLSKLLDDTQTVNKITTLVATVLGISQEDLLDGNVPDSSLTVDYMLSGNAIASLSAQLSLDMEHSDSKLIEEDELVINVDVNAVNVTNNYGSGVVIDFVNDTQEINSYKGYDESIISLSVPIDFYNANGELNSNNDYSFNVTTQIFQDDSVDNFLFMEYLDKRTDVVDRAIYVYNNRAYVYLKGDTDTKAQCIYTFYVDLSDVANRVVGNDLNGTATIDIFTMVGYILRNLTITEEKIGFLISPDFFTALWYNFDDMLNFIDSQCVKQVLDAPEFSEFLTYIKTNEVVFSFEYNNSTMLRILDDDDNDIAKIINMLGQIEEDPQDVPIDEYDDTDTDDDNNTDNNDDTADDNGDNGDNDGE